MSRKLPVYVRKGNRTAAEKHARELLEEVTVESPGAYSGGGTNGIYRAGCRTREKGSGLG